MTMPSTNNERLARIEVTVEAIKQDQSSLRLYLERVVSEIRQKQDKMQMQVDERAMFCIARAKPYDDLQVVGLQHENRIKEIEQLLPQIKELIVMKNKIYMTATLGAFLGSAVGLLVIGYLFKMVIGSVP